MRGRTRTAVRTKKKKRGPRVVRASMNGSTSFTRLGRRRFRRFGSLAKAVAHVRALATTSSGAVTAAQSKQGATQFGLLIGSDLVAIRTAANAGVATENELKLFIHSSRCKLHLRNQSNSLCTALIYDITTKRQPFATSFDTPYEAWQKGMTDMALAGHEGNIHQVPNFSSEFRRFFSIAKVTKVLMEAGQQHEHTQIHGFNRLFNTTTVGAGPYQSYPGVTSWVMVVFYGSLGHESATAGNVGFTPITLDYAHFKEDKFSYIETTLPSYTFTNGLPAVVDFDMMGENQDADVNAVTA